MPRLIYSHDDNLRLVLHRHVALCNMGVIAQNCLAPKQIYLTHFKFIFDFICDIYSKNVTSSGVNQKIFWLTLLSALFCTSLSKWWHCPYRWLVATNYCPLKILAAPNQRILATCLIFTAPLV